jgi:hypothetical protein
MPENILQHAHPITTAHPPVLDKTVAAIAGALSAILLTLRVSGVMPHLDIPPDVVLLIVTSLATLVASIRAQREGVSKRGTAETVTGLVNEIVALREAAAAAAITTPLALIPETPPTAPSPVPKPSELVKRQGG